MQTQRQNGHLRLRCAAQPATPMVTKPRNSPRTKAPPRPLGWIFVGGFASGVLISVLTAAILWPRATVAPRPAGTTSASTPANAAARADTNGAPAKIKYQYEDTLKNNEVPVPAKNEPAPVAAKSSAGQKQMLLQAGSFRSAADADSLRAELLLLGLGRVTTRDTLLPSGEVWHRVIIGPFANEALARKTQTTLASQNIDTFPFEAQTAARPSNNDSATPAPTQPVTPVATRAAAPAATPAPGTPRATPATP